MTEIIWANCAERMPPDDSKVIAVVGYSVSQKPNLVFGSLVKSEYLRWKSFGDAPVLWTEFTPEKWEYLNK